jgi:hypothetical protein
LKFFPGYNTPDSLEWGREGKEGVGQRSKRREKSRDGSRRGRYEDGRDGRFPFTNSRYAIDYTAYTGPRMQHGL